MNSNERRSRKGDAVKININSRGEKGDIREITSVVSLSLSNRSLAGKGNENPSFFRKLRLVNIPIRSGASRPASGRAAS